MPLGWLIIAYRQTRDRTTPAEAKAPHGDRIATWQTGLDGIDWLDRLVADGCAQLLAYNGGYPFEYTGRAKDLLPPILEGPPHANAVWKRDFGDRLLPNYIGHTDINLDLAAACTPDEWLIIEVWDES